MMRIWKKHILRVSILILFLSACVPAVKTINLPNPQIHRKVISHTSIPPVATVTPVGSQATINPPTPILMTITPTIDPYHDLTIEALRKRIYGGGVLQSEGLLKESSQFNRYQFKYRSNGLDLYGFLDEPFGDGPFPVIVVLHGAVDPQSYNTVDYTERYVDSLAEAGFLVLKPNLRGYPPSQDKDNEFGIGDTIDVLNLIALIRTQAGTTGLLQKANKEKIGIWGHSMGGGIVLRVLEIDPHISAAVLYASLNADERLNLAHFGNDGRRDKKIQLPNATLELLSPVNYLNLINAPISIHHGADDPTVPVQWSRDLCKKLQDLDKQRECYLYPGQLHTFQNSGDLLFEKRTLDFFNKYLK
jgi:dipeptidyl aminopeptidase/acylaminoacyl peptidase